MQHHDLGRTRSPHLLALPRVQELLLNYCFDYHSLPVEDDRLLAVLGHAFGIACLRRGSIAPAIVARRRGNYRYQPRHAADDESGRATGEG